MSTKPGKAGDGESSWVRDAESALLPHGVIGASLPGYESRLGQVEMARAVARSLNEGRHSVIEAGTGVGKSLAYLAPAVLSGQQVVVATATKSLQDQLWYKDIPFLQRVLGQFRAAMVKGISNYLCLDRWDDLNQQLDLSSGRDGRQGVERWIRDTETGEIDELTGSYPSEFISQLTVDADGCLGSKCRFAEAGCFAMQARRRARDAKVIVANHALLCADLAIKIDTGAKVAILPSADAFVVDEAHQLENAATGAFETRITNNGVPRFCADKALARYVDPDVLRQIVDLNSRLFKSIERIGQGQRQRWLLSRGVPDAGELFVALDRLAANLANGRDGAALESEEAAARYDKLVERAVSLARTAGLLAREEVEDGLLRYAERLEGHRFVGLAVHLTPIEVGPKLEKALFESGPTVCTSATLAVGDPEDPFRYFRSRVGCPDDAECLSAESPFDYAEQALIYLPRSMPDPGRGDSPIWDNALHSEIESLVSASRGRAFLLFTSASALRRAQAVLSKRLGYPCLVQGEMPRSNLLSTFKETDGAVLFGLRSFWEGVDVPGEALSLVVIDRLPFAVPDDPIVSARVDLIRERGGNWFGEYTLPSAALLLKQGFGRLIRRADDRGVVAIMDPRIRTRSYGSLILNALPPARRTSDIKDVRRFFAPAVA